MRFREILKECPSCKTLKTPSKFLNMFLQETTIIWTFLKIIILLSSHCEIIHHLYAFYVMCHGFDSQVLALMGVFHTLISFCLCTKQVQLKDNLENHLIVSLYGNSRAAIQLIGSSLRFILFECQFDWRLFDVKRPTTDILLVEISIIKLMEL